MDQVKTEIAGDAKTFATNEAEIAVAPASKSKVTSIDDLAAPGVKVALCEPQVPCGALAQTVLSNANVTVHPVTQGLDVKTTLAYVTSGEVDAAMVYVTDVLAAGTKVIGVQVPPADNASTSYPIAVVKDSKEADLGEAFEAYVLSPAGQQVLQAAGFKAP
jgi:molybdate transport system substrate-binding protein